MEWEGREESSNVEDDRGSSGGESAGGGGFGLGGGGFGGRGLTIGGGVGVLVIIVLGLIFGVLPNFGGGGPDPNAGGLVQQNNAPGQADPSEEKMAHFSKIVFKDTEIVWDKLFKEMGKTYKKPILHLYTDRVNSGCGSATASVGPFYCPADEKVYLDLSFFQDMVRKLNSPGEFARAYVIAHEVGHHVQHLLGYTKREDQFGKSEGSVRLELQADYFAGVWAHYADQEFHYLQKGDIESAMNTAKQIGDDRLQRKSSGTVRPETFTHGTSAQRMKWFNEGFKTGDVKGASKLFDLPYKDL